MDDADVAEFISQLQIRTQRGPITTGPADPQQNGYGPWTDPASLRAGSISPSAIPGNIQYGGWRKAWQGVTVPLQAYSCRSRFGDWLHVELWKVDDHLLVKLYTDWN